MVGEAFRLVGSAGSKTSAEHGTLTLAGRTLRGSEDGQWIGKKVAQRVAVGADGCFALSLAPFEAQLLVTS